MKARGDIRFRVFFCIFALKFISLRKKQQGAAYWPLLPTIIQWNTAF